MKNICRAILSNLSILLIHIIINVILFKTGPFNIIIGFTEKDDFYFMLGCIMSIVNCWGMFWSGFVIGVYLEEQDQQKNLLSNAFKV